MRKHDIFPSKYLSAVDLHGKPHVLEIASAPLETLNNNGTEQRKIVVYFKNAKKRLPLNLTNFDAISVIAGTDETDDWPGTRIEVYPTTTEMKGETRPCIRIRAPSAPELQLAPKAKPKQPEPSLDDEIPF
jgi:hypothetical protein